jgi:2-polyprenyl-3-methyl-5-hydroxy-6-metoxy-1,4-benzoquinol methylase
MEKGQFDSVRDTLSRKNALIKRQQEQIHELRALYSDIKKRLAFYEKRDYGADIDPILHNTPKGMDSYFQEIPSEAPYTIFGSALRGLLQDFHVSLDGRDIVDWGVGPGVALNELVRGFSPKSIRGYDTSEAALAHARERIPSGEFCLGDIYAGQSERGDFILCTEVLEHLEDPGKALLNLYEWLNPDGLLLLTVPDGRIDYSRLHINFWSPESWPLFLRRVLRSALIKTGTFQPYEGKVYRNNFAMIRKD